MKIPVIVVSGPTASGKSALALKIAEKYGGEIVSADSMQIYKELSVGTAKPDKSEMERVPHHLVDILEPEEKFSAADFKKRAEEAIEDISSRGRLPIIAGGTGLYIDSLLYSTGFSHPKENPKLRRELAEMNEKEGADAVYAILKSLDGDAAEKIHKNNVKRVIRAIEIIKSTHKSLEESVEKPLGVSPKYEVLYVFINPDRQELYRRIDRRVDEMMEQGLLDEAKMLFGRNVPPDTTSVQAIGYKEFFGVFRGEKSLSDAVDELKRDTRRYAKRQVTWFSRHKDAVRLKKNELSLLEETEEFKRFIALLGKDK
mgnify:FL=1